MTNRMTRKMSKIFTHILVLSWIIWTWSGSWSSKPGYYDLRWNKFKSPNNSFQSKAEC